jgi:glycosyltransferase involved in cell wall biosynthesis
VSSTARARLLLVSPRPPRQDGQGDQRRAHYALSGLSADWDVDVVSWLPDVGAPPGRRWVARPLQSLKAITMVAIRPATVSYVQSLAPPFLARRLRGYDLVLFMTDRSVPLRVPVPYAIDFIDDLAAAAARNAARSSGPAARFWRWESGRLHRFDARLAAGAVLSVAVSPHDAAAISPLVRTILSAIGTAPSPDVGTKVAFTGNLFYAPNAEAALWMCTDLVPRLRALGVDPGDVVIAGRRPPPALQARAAEAGVDLRADVPDLTPVLTEAAVVVAPVVLGSGVQNKVLDAVGACRACVVSPFTNQVLGLVDGQSALVRERTADEFAEAIVTLLHDPALRQRLARNAVEHCAPYTEDAVVAAWRASFADLHCDALDRRGAGGTVA